jgi:hypothetical protein
MACSTAIGLSTKGIFRPSVLRKQQLLPLPEQALMPAKPQVRRFSEPRNIWSSPTEAHALANVLGIRIRLWYYDGRQEEYLPNLVHPTAPPEIFPEYNVLFTGDHYQSLVPRGVVPDYLRVTVADDLTNSLVSTRAGHSWHRALVVTGVACFAAARGVGSMWFGHDMSVWPPTNIFDPASRRAVTLSWLYMPIILAALGVHCPLFTFRRTARFQAFKLAYRAEFQHRRVTWASLEAVGAVDGDFHLNADMQDELIGMSPGVAYELAQYANDLQRSGIDD